MDLMQLPFWKAFFYKEYVRGENYDFMLHFMGFHLHQPEARVVALDVVKIYTLILKLMTKKKVI